MFDNQIDPTWRSDLFKLIRDCDQLDWQLLTKRPQNIKRMLPCDWWDGYSNVWLGTTAEDASAYRERVPHLLEVPAAIHFVSYEPAIGALDRLDINGLFPDWLIIGGESGVRSDLVRRTEPQWARDAITECGRLGIAAFLKQWGTYQNNPMIAEELQTVQEAMRSDPPDNGKGGAKLDGRLWRDFPLEPKASTIRRARSTNNGTERRAVFA